MNHNRLYPTPSRRTYYLHRDGSVSKAPTPSHLLHIRAESLEQALLMVQAVETQLRRQGIYFPFQEVSRG